MYLFNRHYSFLYWVQLFNGKQGSGWDRTMKHEATASFNCVVDGLVVQSLLAAVQCRTSSPFPDPTPGSSPSPTMHTHHPPLFYLLQLTTPGPCPFPQTFDALSHPKKFEMISFCHN